MRLLHLFQALLGNRLKWGPFRGMRYVREAVGSAHTPKVLGTYEMEIHPWICEVFHRPPPVIIDVGAAEGYYAVGFACACPGSQVVAFEMAPQGRELLALLAQLNDVSRRVQIHGKCEVADLARALEGSTRALVFMDVEGAEADLLDPQCCPALESADIIVELHEFAVPGVGNLMRTRFASTHSIEEVKAKHRGIGDAPPLFRLLLCWWPRRLRRMMGEHRPPGMSWIRLIPICQPQ